MEYTEKKAVIDEIKAVLDNMDDGDLISLWNEYVQKSNTDSSEIFNMDELNDLYGEMTVREFTDRIGHIDSDDDYFRISYGGIESFNSIDDENSPYYADDLAEYIYDSEDYFDNDDLYAVLAKHFAVPEAWIYVNKDDVWHSQDEDDTVEDEEGVLKLAAKEVKRMIAEDGVNLEDISVEMNYYYDGMLVDDMAEDATQKVMAEVNA